MIPRSHKRLSRHKIPVRVSVDLEDSIVGGAAHKVTELNGPEDPDAFRTSLVWSISVF